jgi:purine-binding chemotaxis protein CheW
MSSQHRSTSAAPGVSESAVPTLEGRTEQAPSVSLVRAAIVSIGGELFTIDIRCVREVFVVESITPVPGMPSGLVGVTNLRGSVVPLLDLRAMIGLSSEAALKYAVVLNRGDSQVGVLVDTVPEIRTLSKDLFLQAPAGNGEGRNPFVSTVVNLEDRLSGVLETSAVFSHFEETT